MPSEFFGIHVGEKEKKNTKQTQFKKANKWQFPMLEMCKSLKNSIT